MASPSFARSFDPWDESLDHQTVWDVYRALREQGPVSHSDARGGFWILSRFEHVRRAAADHDTFSSAHGVVIGQTGVSEPPGAPLEYDPPEHARIRTAMFAPFRGKAVLGFTEMVDRHVRRLLDSLDGRDDVDLMAEVANQLPVAVISDVIGFDAPAAARNRELSLAVINAVGHEAMFARRDAYMDFLSEQIRLAAPGDGLLGKLTHSSAGFTERELLGIVFALGLAGHHSTSNALASLLIRAADPELRDRWLSSATDLRGLGAFIEETLRIEPPIHLQARRTMRPVHLDGVDIPAGEQVALLFASANRDERQYPDPDMFDAGRGGTHLGFGHGIHLCLGMSLARMEMTALLGQLTERYPRYRLTGPPESAGMVFGHHMSWKSVPAALG